MNLANKLLIRSISKHETTYCILAVICGVPNFVFILNILGIKQIIMPLYIVVPCFIYFTIIAFYSLHRLDDEPITLSQSGKLEDNKE